MTKYLCIALLLIMAVSASADRLVRIAGIDSETPLRLLADGYDVTAGNIRQGWVDVYVEDESAASILTRYGSDVRVLPREWGELLPENSRDAGYFYDLEENWSFWCDLAVSHPDLADTPVVIGQSYENRDIYTITMTSSSGPADKPTLYFSALIHAREPSGNSVLIDYAQWLADEYGSDTMATFILDNAEVHFLPISNPDGYQENMPGGGMHRKNMNFSDPVPSSGIDLNRNWPYKWAYDDVGSSGDPYDETYRGESPASEPETQVQMDYIDDIAPLAAMNYHSYGGYLLYPWGYNNTPTPDQTTFEGWAAQMTQYNEYDYGRAGQILYVVNGEQNDYCYSDSAGSPSVIAMTPEINNGGFWGGQSDTTAIEEFCEECRYMNIMICMNALDMVGIEGAESYTIEPSLFLGSVHPNPVPAGALQFGVTAPAGQPVSLELYDMAGRRAADLGSVEGSGNPTSVYRAVPDGLPSGVYMLVAEGDGQVRQQRVTLLR
ncbi:MAG: M14 family zinc carboxypeptidase [Candidatus Fermentibacteraceae bacterium]